MRIGVAVLSDGETGWVALVAARLGLPFIGALRLEKPIGTGWDALLLWTGERLELRELGPGASGPIYTDFVEGRAAHRRRYGGGKGQPLARAVGIKGERAPIVIDATAGLGRDAFVLASLGCGVTLLERSLVVGALLDDGLRRAREHPDTAAVAARMRVQIGDARDILARLDEAARPEVVYLDPMYPERAKTALPKKEMRLLRELLGADADAGELLSIARQRALARVVVKRPRAAPPLGGTLPNAAIHSKNTRFDVYLRPTREKG